MVIRVIPFRQFLECNSTSKLFTVTITIQMELLLAEIVFLEHSWRGRLVIAASRPKTIKSQIAISLAWKVMSLSSLYQFIISFLKFIPPKIHLP